MATHTEPAPAHAEEVHASHGTRFYWVVGAILAVATAIEVGTFIAYQENMIPKFLEAIVLLILTFLKGSGVVLFFMHLQGDRPPYWFMFLAPLGLAVTLVMLMNLIVHSFVGIAG